MTLGLTTGRANSGTAYQVSRPSAAMPTYRQISTYDDTLGQLTREWFGSEKARLWMGRWPRYHIEVKSTRGGEEEPFHMSWVQMITVRAHVYVGVGVRLMVLHRHRGSRNA